MKCSFCDHELTPDMLREKGCGGCLGGCRKIHCPYCGQENPVVPDFLEKVLKREKPEDASRK
jgi:hypothetical protein